MSTRNEQDLENLLLTIKQKDSSQLNEHEQLILLLEKRIKHRSGQERELNESQDFIKRIINTIPARIFWKDLNLNYLGCNTIFANDAGFESPNEIVGKNDLELIWKNQAEQYRNDDLQVIRSGNSKLLIEETQLTPEGRTIHLLTNKIPLRDTQGNIYGVLGTYTDITSLKHTELELIKATEKAMESEQLKSAFLANLSHEIRTPLNAILGFANLLSDPGLKPEERVMYTRHMEENGERMIDVFDNIISISKIESHQIRCINTLINVDDLLSLVEASQKSKAEKKSIRLIPVIEAQSNSFNIYTDQDKLYAILVYLVGNAIKFTERGFVSFGYHVENDLLKFFVKDSGIGIKSDKLKVIFERFRQGDDSTSRAHEGTGLGLAIAKAYIELLGGNIWVESQYGFGSVFFFTIPIAPSKLNQALNTYRSNNQTENRS